MNRAQSAGAEGERVAEWVLAREGWQILGRQVNVYGHTIDFVALSPFTGEEWLVEVKVWGTEPSGKDTMKKAIADAYDIAQAGEERPYMLVMSHALNGLYADMITRARRAGVINDVRVIGTSEHD